MTIDQFHYKTYDDKHYNCAHFVNEVWKALTGQDISLGMQGFTVGRENRKMTLSHLRIFKQISKPITPSIAFMQAPDKTHVGIFYKGKIFHLSKGGVRLENLDTASFGFKKVRFYICSV